MIQSAIDASRATKPKLRLLWRGLGYTSKWLKPVELYSAHGERFHRCGADKASLDIALSQCLAQRLIQGVFTSGAGSLVHA